MVDTSKSVHCRMPKGTYDRIEKEIEVYGEYRSAAEFVLDAVKFYLDYLVRMRIEDSKVKTVVRMSSEDLTVEDVIEFLKKYPDLGKK